MRAYDIIRKKRDGGTLSKEEIYFFVSRYCSGSITDEQAAAFLMAVYFRGLDPEETYCFTMAIVESGSTADLSGISGIKVDKHSTGGVGDKTTLIALPVAAACGAKIAKLSGRGLGHTGGTVDKLEAIPGYKTSLSGAAFAAVVNRTGAGIAGQSADLAPADKRFYALRDVTATVDVPCLIASGIMSKKLASGADRIVLDVKVGSGAFNKTLEAGKKLAHMMVDIGNRAGKKTVALLTDMDAPLGYAIGNSVELTEALETLHGRGPTDLVQVSLSLAAELLFLSEKGSPEQCRALASAALKSGAALAKFEEMIAAQGGDARCCRDYGILPSGKITADFTAQAEGYITGVDCEAYGRAALLLGAGRNRKEDPVDHGAGIILKKKTGDSVSKGETIATLYSTASDPGPALELLAASTFIGSEKPAERRMILGRIE